MLRSVFAAGAIAALVAAGPAAPASAAFSPTPDDTWMTNGKVFAVVRAGDTVYLGGSFDSVRACEPGTACSVKPVPVLNVAALDATTGGAIRSFKPQVQGDGAIVYALAVLGDKLFIGGQFAAVDGTPRRNLAAVDLETGALDADVDAQVGVDNTDRIRGMVASASRVYAAGAFASVDGERRSHLASFDVDGNLDPLWKPRTPAATRALGMTCDGSSVIVGGAFREAAGTGGDFESRSTLAIFDAATGGLDPWTPPAADIPNGVQTYDLQANCERVFAGYGGANRIFAFDLTMDAGNTLWTLKAGGNVQAVALRGDRVLFGGHFSQVSLLNTNKNVRRVHFAVADLDGNVQDDWTPSFGGDIRSGPWDILVMETQVWVGGGFTDVSATPRWCIARFSDAV